MDGVLLQEATERRRCSEIAGPAIRPLLEGEDQAACRPAQLGCMLYEGLQHRLELEGGPVDALQELARHRLMLQGLFERSILRLDFLKETGVFDGDGRMTGEGRH